MRVRSIVSVLSAAVLFCGAGRAQTWGRPNLPSETLRLSNGLTVRLAPDPHARLVSVAVAYRAGAGDDPDGLLGLAHMAEHVLSYHGRHSPDPMRDLEAAGAGHVNATTSLDATVYYESVPPERLATVLWVESDRMGYGADAVTEADVDAERAVLANEDRDRHLDTPLAAVGPFAMREMYPDWHPYARFYEAQADLGHIHAPDVVAFVRTWYVPSNAVLAIAGDFDRDATIEAVKRYFGSLPSTAAPTRPVLPEWTKPPMKLTIQAPSGFNTVSLSWPTPAAGSKEDAALDLAATALAGTGNQRFARTLLATHLATAVSARQVSERSGSVFVVSARVSPGVDADAVVTALQAGVDDLARSCSAAEIATARDVRRHAGFAGLETTWGRASRLVSLRASDTPPGPDFQWGLDRYAAIDPGDVARTVTTRLARMRRVATIVRPSRTAPSRGMLLSRDEDAP